MHHQIKINLCVRDPSHKLSIYLIGLILISIYNIGFDYYVISQKLGNETLTYACRYMEAPNQTHVQGARNDKECGLWVSPFEHINDRRRNFGRKPRLLNQSKEQTSIYEDTFESRAKRRDKIRAQTRKPFRQNDYKDGRLNMTDTNPTVLVTFKISGQMMRKCSGVIIDPGMVITLAACMPPDGDAALLKVWAGDRTFDNIKNNGSEKIDDFDNFESVHRVRRYFLSNTIKDRRPSKVTSAQLMDFAILKLDSEIKYSSKVASVCLPSFTELKDWNMYCFLNGYGSDGGSKTTVYTIDVKPVECLPEWGYVGREVVCYQKANHLSDNTQIRNVCWGDLGGPVMCRSPLSGRWHLLALSLGPNDDRRNCDLDNDNGVNHYLNVYALRHEIFRMKYLIKTGQLK